MIQRIWIWVARVGMSLTVLSLGLLALGTFMGTRIYDDWVECTYDPLPPFAQAWRLANETLGSAAEYAGIPADRFYLKKKVLNETVGRGSAWTFYFQVKGDREPVRQLRVFVDRCPHADLNKYELEKLKNSRG